MRRLKYLSFSMLLVFYGCSDGTTSTYDEGESNFPEGAVVNAYENLPGRTRVILYSGDKVIGEGDYLDGQPEGAWTDYDPTSGVVVKVTNFLKGKRHGVELTFNNRNGQLETKQSFNQDFLHGQSLIYDARKIVEEKNYFNGVLSGMVRKFYPSGQVLEEAPYVKGQIHGTAKWFDEEGNLTIQYEYENGKFIEDTTPPKPEKEEGGA